MKFHCLSNRNSKTNSFIKLTNRQREREKTMSQIINQINKTNNKQTKRKEEKKKLIKIKLFLINKYIPPPYSSAYQLYDCYNIIILYNYIIDIYI